MPDILSLDAYGGDYLAYQEAVYARFCADFCGCAAPDFCGRYFLIDREKVDGKCKRFWHLVSDGNIEEERIPDLRRCERIAWVRHLIDNRWSGEFAYWRTEKKLLIALRDFSYVVVLKGDRKVVVLITAFPIERNHRSIKLRTEYHRADEKYR